MDTHTHKALEDKSRSASNDEAHLPISGESTFQFVNNRPRTLDSTTLRDIGLSNAQLKQASQVRNITGPNSVKQHSFQNPSKSSKSANIVQQQNVVQRVNAGWNGGWVATPLGVQLTAGINGTSPPAVILGQLMANFAGLGAAFTYDKAPGDHMAFLGGTMRGDCGTLARAFKAIGEGYYQIAGMDTQNYSDSWTQAGATPYGGNQPDCDGGTSWIFGSHTWATHGGTTYDILFCVNNLAPHTAELREVRSIFFPEKSYSEMADGSITYPLRLAPAPAYVRVPPEIASKVLFVVKNAPVMLSRALLRLLAGGLSALGDGIVWIADKVRSWLGNDDDDGHGAFGRLPGRED